MTETQRSLEELIDAGLTFGETIKVFAARQGPEAARYIAAARHYHVEGEVEIDDTTIVSGSEDPGGDYVMAWVWVSDKDLHDVGQACSCGWSNTSPDLGAAEDAWQDHIQSTNGDEHARELL